MLNQLVTESRSRPGVWEIAPLRWSGRVGTIAAIAAAHVLLIWLGYGLREVPNVPAVLWPAAGLAFVSLRLSALSLWPALIVTQLLVELGMRLLLQHPFVPQTAVLFAASNCVSALVSATAAGMKPEKSPWQAMATATCHGSVAATAIKVVAVAAKSARTYIGLRP